MPVISFQATITKHLNQLEKVCESHNPDSKHKVGRQLGIIYFWSMVEKFAKAKKEEAWKYVEAEKIIADTSKLDQGDYTLAESPKFHASAKVSAPINRFSDDALADQLAAKYKVPRPITKEMIGKAKVPTKSTVTKSVQER